MAVGDIASYIDHSNSVIPIWLIEILQELNADIMFKQKGMPKKNGQTIDHFFSITKSNESDEISEESKDEPNDNDDYF
ncbi:5267_t:CDS:2 [Funneliformis mosseae]|uniref:5267_t:CDS:1 n=1 Tax=Funneliformis mosseae TaxID=27381 RepID=A0A9N9BZ81_FUNMO|nr:5267_t:CDS:2 [Funneliformis mosseae]